MTVRRCLFTCSRKIAGAALLLPLFLLLQACSDSQAESTQPPTPYYHQANSQVLTKQTGYEVKRTFIGRVEAKQNAQIGFEQSGKVARLFVSEGERVNKGSLLAQQDIELLSIERLEMNAQLAQNNADLSLTDANLKRLRSLKKRGFTSEQSLDELHAKRKSLIANRQRLNASIAGNESRITKASLYAPFDAVIATRLIDEGEVVAAGSPAFALLQQGNVEIKVGIPVDLLAQVSKPQEFSIRIGNQSYAAKLLTTGSDVNSVTRTLQLRFQLNENSPLVNGQLAYLSLQQKISQPGYWVPLTAITDGQRGMWNIYTLKNTDSEHLFQLNSHTVQVHYTSELQAFISAQLLPEQRILSAGLHRLVPGQVVRLAERVSLREAN